MVGMSSISMTADLTNSIAIATPAVNAVPAKSKSYEKPFVYICKIGTRFVSGLLLSPLKSLIPNGIISKFYVKHGIG